MTQWMALRRCYSRKRQVMAELESFRMYHGTKRDGDGTVDGGYGEPQDEEELAVGCKRLDLNGEFSDGKRLELDDELEEICARGLGH
jgi:hypothetical protein